jgi:transposase-like protein
VARPLMLDDDLQRNILAAIRVGNYLEPSARAYGVAPSTLYVWKQRADKALAAREKGEEPDANDARCLEFMEAVDAAEATSELSATTHLAKAMPRDTRAIVEFLRRRFPDRWKEPAQRTELTGAGGGPIEVVPARERLAGKILELTKRLASGAGQPAEKGDDDAALDREEETA